MTINACAVILSDENTILRSTYDFIDPHRTIEQCRRYFSKKDEIINIENCSVIFNKNITVLKKDFSDGHFYLQFINEDNNLSTFLLIGNKLYDLMEHIDMRKTEDILIAIDQVFKFPYKNIEDIYKLILMDSVEERMYLEGQKNRMKELEKKYNEILSNQYVFEDNVDIDGEEQPTNTEKVEGDVLKRKMILGNQNTLILKEKISISSDFNNKIISEELNGLFCLLQRENHFTDLKIKRDKNLIVNYSPYVDRSTLPFCIKPKKGSFKLNKTVPLFKYSKNNFISDILTVNIWLNDSEDINWESDSDISISNDEIKKSVAIEITSKNFTFENIAIRLNKEFEGKNITQINNCSYWNYDNEIKLNKNSNIIIDGQVEDFNMFTVEIYLYGKFITQDITVENNNLEKWTEIIWMIK